MRIAIVGAGIGGLTAAVALLRRGFEVEVYEQAPEAHAPTPTLSSAPPSSAANSVRDFMLPPPNVE